MDKELNAEKGEEKQTESENKTPTISSWSQTCLRNMAGQNEDTKLRMELELTVSKSFKEIGKLKSTDGPNEKEQEIQNIQKQSYML